MAVSQRETPLLQPRIARSPDPAARHVLVAASRHAGSGKKRVRLAEIVTHLTAAGYTVDVTSQLDELTRLANECWERGDLRAVMAGGGDGTAALVRNHVPLEVPLLPLPLGTESLLGRYISQSSDPAAVCRTLDEGVIIELDLGRAGNRVFLMMISAGLDAEVVRRLHDVRRGNITHFSYVKPILATIRSYTHPELRLYCEGSQRPDPVPCRWLFGFNLPLYACGLQLAPSAVGTDGQFDVCTFRAGSLVADLRYLWHVVRGSHLRLPGVQFAQCGEFRVEAAGRAQVAYQLDGDWGGVLPVHVEVLPGQLRLLVSREAAARLEFRLPNHPPATSQGSDCYRQQGV